MRIGIIGFGRAGGVHMEAWQRSTAEVTAVCDPAPQARENARAAGFKAYEDVASMLESERLDAVSVCTPPADHVGTALMCLRQGVHVLCEKPLALSVREASILFRAAIYWERHLLLATKFRHIESMIAARN